MRTRLDVFGRCPGESARSRMQDVCPAFAVNRCRRGPMNDIVAFGGDQIVLSLRKLASARGCVMIHGCILKNDRNAVLAVRATVESSPQLMVDPVLGLAYSGHHSWARSAEERVQELASPEDVPGTYHVLTTTGSRGRC